MITEESKYSDVELEFVEKPTRLICRDCNSNFELEKNDIPLKCSNCKSSKLLIDNADELKIISYK